MWLEKLAEITLYTIYFSIFIGGAFLFYALLCRLKRLMSFSFVLKLIPAWLYHCHYTCDKDLMDDTRARWMLSLCHHGYTDSYLARYYKNIDLERIPIRVLISWARTIAEDLVRHPSPILRVDFWNNHLRSRLYEYTSFHPDMQIFEAHEIAYLWGAVYYWLSFFTEHENMGSLLKHIDEHACPLLFARPYFEYFVKIAKKQPYGKTSTTVHVNIGQLAIENNGTMCNTSSLNNHDTGRKNANFGRSHSCRQSRNQSVRR